MLRRMEAIEKGITDSAALQRLTGDLLDAMAEEAVMEEIAGSAERTEVTGLTGNGTATFLTDTDKTLEESSNRRLQKGQSQSSGCRTGMVW